MIITKPQDIELYRLLTLKQGLKLELRGLKMSRGKSANSIVCSMLGLRRGTKVTKTLEALQSYISTTYSTEH